MRRTVAAWALTGLTLSVVPAAAKDCALQMVTSVEMLPVSGGARMMVPVRINGVTEHLLLGTAGGMTTLTQAALANLNLHPIYSEHVRLLDAKGNASNSYFRVANLEMGSYLKARNMTLMVTPDPDAGAHPPLDGILAADVMTRYDVEMDFAAHKLNYFTPDHCEGRVVYWPAGAIGVVPIEIKNRIDDQSRAGPVSAHIALFGIPGGAGDGVFDPAFQNDKPAPTGVDIRLRVQLDGKDFTANLDTGSETSTLNSDTAKAVFDVTADSPGSSPAGSLDLNPDSKTGAGETVVVNGNRVFEHSFHTLSFGGVTVSNPHFTVGPQRTGEKDKHNDFFLGSHIERLDDKLAPDITIGMNIIKNLHLYIAFREGRVYVTAPNAVGKS